jgi:two-component system response regulator DevR
VTSEKVKIRMLLVDGHALFRQAIRTVFDEEPDISVVAEAHTGQQGVVEAVRTHPDVVILDVSSPDGETARTVHLLRQRVPGCRIIVLAGEDEQATLVEVVEAGANGYLTKESPLVDLIAATRDVCRGDTVIPGRMLGQLIAGLMDRRRDQQEMFERLSRLTPREREVLELLGMGANSKKIAWVLMISPETARTHVQNLLGKLGVHSRLEAAAFATQSRTGVTSTSLVPALLTGPEESSARASPGSSRT